MRGIGAGALLFVVMQLAQPVVVRAAPSGMNIRVSGTSTRSASLDPYEGPLCADMNVEAGNIDTGAQHQRDNRLSGNSCLDN